jgi:hypothetical protein
MKTNKFARFAIAAAAFAALLTATFAPLTAGTAAASPLDGRGTPGAYAASAIAAAPLDAAEVSALNAAIQEEYLARDTYQAAVNQFGSVAPFANIVRSEQQHINALSRLFTRYGLAVPADGNTGTAAFANLTAACQAGVDAEIEDAALYDTLKPQVDNADVLRVFANLQSASLNNHLPAFEACN